jgi:hypothetical protein
MAREARLLSVLAVEQERQSKNQPRPFLSVEDLIAAISEFLPLGTRSRKPEYVPDRSIRD